MAVAFVLRSFGSPNYGNVLSGNACYLPRVAGMAATTGSFWIADVAQHFPDRFDHEGWTMPEVMFVWGNNPLIANSDGFFGHWVIDLHEARHEDRGHRPARDVPGGEGGTCTCPSAPAPTRRWRSAC